MSLPAFRMSLLPPSSGGRPEGSHLHKVLLQSSQRPQLALFPELHGFNAHRHTMFLRSVLILSALIYLP